MLQSLLLVATSFVALANAQSTNNTAVGIEAIEAHFTQAGLVPDLLTTFDHTSYERIHLKNV